MRFDTGVKEDELDDKLLSGLRLAEVFGRHDFFVTSGNRKGDTRCHGVGKAVDLRCWESDDRWRMVKALVMVGFTRIVLYSRHIHVDVCEGADYPQEILGLGGASR